MAVRPGLDERQSQTTALHKKKQNHTSYAESMLSATQIPVNPDSGGPDAKGRHPNLFIALFNIQ